MTIENLQKHFTVERLVHAAMVIFALYSAGNIQEAFYSSGKSFWLSWVLGIAMGIALVASAISLAKIPHTEEKEAYYFLFGVVLLMALLSGFLQLGAYADKGYYTSIILAFGLPLVCEAGLAMGMSRYEMACARQRIRNVGANTEEQIAHAVSEALSDVDVTKVRKYAEKKVDLIVRAQVDRITSMYLADAAQDAQLAVTEPSNGNGRDAAKHGDLLEITGNGSSKLPAMNEARQAKMEERRKRIIALVTEFGPMTVAEITERLDGAAKEKTVRTDCNQLAEDGKLLKDGTRWQVPMLPQLGIPHNEPAVPYTNGAH